MILLKVCELSDDLRAFGIEKGDIVLVRASLKKIGIKENQAGDVLVNALLEVVGSEGTILGLSFTKNYFIPTIDKKNIFTVLTPPTTGGFARAMLKHPQAIRSTHPTNSYVAIGKHAYTLLKDHNEYSTCFLPIDKLITMYGKMILIGCVFDSPGFTTVHCVQEKLGLSSKSILKGLIGVYYEKESRIKLFRRKDFGGCNAGFYKFYGHYVRNEKLICGEVGMAYSIMIQARDAYEIEMNITQSDYTYPLCDNPDCFTCRGTWYYNKTDMIAYYMRKITNKIF